MRLNYHGREIAPFADLSVLSKGAMVVGRRYAVYCEDADDNFTVRWTATLIRYDVDPCDGSMRTLTAVFDNGVELANYADDLGGGWRLTGIETKETEGA